MTEVAVHETPQHERFHMLYQADYGRILAYALRRTACPEDAADVVADTFATAWRRLENVPEGAEATLWLYGVARRILANHHRKQSTHAGLIALLARDYEEAVCRDPLPSDRTALTAAWQSLSAPDRDLLGLALWESLDPGQIATVLGCTRSIVKVRLHRARRRFARELERRGIEVKPAASDRHVQGGRVSTRPDTEAT